MRLAALLLLPALSAALPAQTAAPAYTYVKLVDTMVAMRDGVKLHTSIYVPQNYSGPLAIVFTRTPYSITGSAGRMTGSYRELAEDGYAFAGVGALDGFDNVTATEIGIVFRADGDRLDLLLWTHHMLERCLELVGKTPVGHQN